MIPEGEHGTDGVDPEMVVKQGQPVILCRIAAAVSLALAGRPYIYVIGGFTTLKLLAGERWVSLDEEIGSVTP